MMTKAPRNAASTKARKRPKKVSRWVAFLTANPAPYTGIFALGEITLPKGFTPTKLIRKSLTDLTSGKWETLTAKDNGKTFVFAAFADKADFDKVKLHHNGKLWKSNIVGSVDGFSVTIP
jgi:hypothetical protein